MAIPPQIHTTSSARTVAVTVGVIALTVGWFISMYATLALGVVGLGIAVFGPMLDAERRLPLVLNGIVVTLSLVIWVAWAANNS